MCRRATTPAAPVASWRAHVSTGCRETLRGSPPNVRLPAANQAWWVTCSSRHVTRASWSTSSSSVSRGNRPSPQRGSSTSSSSSGPAASRSSETSTQPRLMPFSSARAIATPSAASAPVGGARGSPSCSSCWSSGDSVARPSSSAQATSAYAPRRRANSRPSPSKPVRGSPRPSSAAVTAAELASRASSPEPGSARRTLPSPSTRGVASMSPRGPPSTSSEPTGRQARARAIEGSVPLSSSKSPPIASRPLARHRRVGRASAVRCSPRIGPVAAGWHGPTDPVPGSCRSAARRGRGR